MHIERKQSEIKITTKKEKNDIMKNIIRDFLRNTGLFPFYCKLKLIFTCRRISQIFFFFSFFFFFLAFCILHFDAICCVFFLYSFFILFLLKTLLQSPTKNQYIFYITASFMHKYHTFTSQFYFALYNWKFIYNHQLCYTFTSLLIIHTELFHQCSSAQTIVRYMMKFLMNILFKLLGSTVMSCQNEYALANTIGFYSLTTFFPCLIML